MVGWRRLDEDEVDRMTTAATALRMSRLHHPGAMTPGHPKRHPLCLPIAKTLALAATSQFGAHCRRLAFGADVDALGHVRRPGLGAARKRADPARRTNVGQRVHRTVAVDTQAFARNQTSSHLVRDLVAFIFDFLHYTTLFRVAFEGEAGDYPVTGMHRRLLSHFSRPN